MCPCTALSREFCIFALCDRAKQAQRLQVLGARDVPGLRYIADGAAPIVTDPKVEQSLVAHSPDVSKYKEYLKPPGHSASPLWMPVWELHELEALRAKLFAKEVTREQVGRCLACQKSSRLHADYRRVYKTANLSCIEIRSSQW